MKFAFSTLACPQWTTEQVVDHAVRLGYNGLEWRLLDGEIIDPVRDAEKLKQAIALANSRGVETCAFDTSCKFNFSSASERTQNVESLRQWIAFVRELDALGIPAARILRVFGGASSTGSASSGQNPTEETQWVADALRQVAPQAEEAHATIALETHDDFSSSHRVAQVIKLVDSPAVAALWDSHHPYRVGESVQEVMDQLGEHIAHVHVKDARRVVSDPTKWQLVLMGEGEVPVHEQLQILHKHRYKGYVSVEWEKRWHPEIVDPEIALPEHIDWLRAVEKSLGK
ncbi:MAG: TIM barrel protein [Ktedonobacteraceae bacterium]